MIVARETAVERSNGVTITRFWVSKGGGGVLVIERVGAFAEECHGKTKGTVMPNATVNTKFEGAKFLMKALIFNIYIGFVVVVKGWRD